MTVSRANNCLPPICRWHSPVTSRRVLDRFPITHTRLMHFHVQIEIAQQAVLDHLQVQFAHAADQRLPRLFVLDRAETWDPAA